MKLRFKREIQRLEREIKQRIQAKKLSQRKEVWFVAKALAELSGQQPSMVLKRILPRDKEQLENVLRLYQKIKDKRVREMKREPFFSKTFLNFNPTPYQLKFLKSRDKQQSLLWSRQSGKTTSVGLKLFKFCVLHPASQATITAPGFRQSKLVIEKTADWLYKMDPVAYRAWVEKCLRKSIRLRNRSRMKAFPFSLEKIRGETSDIVDVEELAFIPEAEELLHGTLMPQMATRWGRGAQIIVNSTPWGRGFFWRIQNDPKVFPHWRRFTVHWREPVKARLITQDFIDAQREQLMADRFAREYECKFTEDAGRWLSQDLITSCIDSTILEPWKIEESFSDLEFYIGCDLGKKVDYSVVVVLEKVGDTLILRHVHVFSLGTEYGGVIGYIKVLSERWRVTVRACVDVTREEHVLEDLQKVITACEVDGVIFGVKNKYEMASYLKQKMLKKQFKMYYNLDIIANLNIENFELTKTGETIFSHPQGTHDDIFWAICLACAATMKKEPKGPRDAFVFH